MKPPTSIEIFEKKTPLVITIIAQTVLEQRCRGAGASPEPTLEQKAYFIRQADQWMRYLHANNPEWRKVLESKRKDNDSRQWAYKWVEHWATAFLNNPEEYIAKHPELETVHSAIDV